MLNEAVVTDLAKRVGGRFRLATLVQKRARELALGAKPMVEIESVQPVEIALEELRRKLLSIEIRESLPEEKPGQSEF